LGNFYKFNFFWPNLENEIRGQFTNFKIFEGSNYNFWKIWGSICNFFINLLGQIENFGKFEDQNAKFEKL